MTRAVAEPCPDPQILAAFAEGALDETTYASVARHIADCVECPIVVGETVALLRQDIRQRRRRAVSRLAVAASLSAAIAIGAWRYFALQPIRHLRAAANTIGYRIAEGHLASARWSPYNQRRSAANASDVRLEAAAARVLRQQPRTAEQWHDRAVALLLMRRYDEAGAALRVALRIAPSDPRYWNDLAVTLLAAGGDAPALVAADRAVAIAPDFTPAHFNRALALEHLGRRPEALAAYRRAESAASPKWRAEIRARIATLISRE